MRKTLSMASRRLSVLLSAGVILLAFSFWASAGEKKAGPGEKAHPPGTSVKWKVRYRVSTGSMPKAVVLTPDESEAWVTNFGNNRRHNITIFEAETGKVKKRISFRGRAVELVFSTDGKKAYVSNFDTHKLMVIDTGTYKVTDSVRVGVNPKIVTLSPSGKEIYVSNWSSNDVSVVDASSLKERARIKAGRNPRGNDTDAKGTKLFVANFNGHTLSVLDLKERKLTNTIKMQRHPRHVTATPDGKYILVSNMGKGSDSVAMVDPVKLEVKDWIEVRRGPKTIMVEPRSRVAFTADYFGRSVSVIDLEQGKAIAAITGLGRGSCGMDLSKDGKTLYLTSWHSNELRAIDLEYFFKPHASRSKP